MKLFKTIDKVLAGFGNIKAMERTHVDTFTENEILKTKGEKIAESNNGGIWIEYEELAGFDFMNATILSNVNIKTFKGSKLSFLGNQEELIINSDTIEIESDYSNVSNRWITKISYIVTQKDIDFIQKKEFNQITIEFKKTTINFFALPINH